MKKTSLAAKVNKRLLSFVVVIVVMVAIFVVYELNIAKNSVYNTIGTTLKAQIKTKQMSKGKIGMVGAIALAADQKVIDSLKSKKRQIVIDHLKKLTQTYKQGTMFKNVKIHIHTKDLKSFIRSWNSKKYGDDLSSFRDTIKKVKLTKKPLYAI